MWKFFAVVLLAAVVALSSADSITDGTELISTFLIHRHGDRTPVPSSISYGTDLDALEAASAKYGYGQLTDLGKARAYRLGQAIRARYDSLLAPQYNRSEIYIRSTDSTRTKMTVLTAMAAVYPAYPGSWNEDINWVPTPYTTVRVKYDFNEAMLNCPTFMTAYPSLMMSNPSRMNKYFDVLNVVSEQLGYNITSYPVLSFSFYDVYVSQRNLGVALGDAIAEIMPQLSLAAGEAMDVIFGDENYVALQAGVLLNEFFTYSDELLAGTDTPRVRIYSAHDVNVFSFMAVTQITPRQGVPPYAASFALELRKVTETGQTVVLPVYRSSPEEDVIYLPVAGCGDSVLCDYETFRELVSQYTLDEDTWRTKCGFTEDLVVDESSVD